MKNLNIATCSCANPNLFRWNSCIWSPLKGMPYTHHEQTAPSWSADQLKSSKSAKSAKLQWKTWISRWVLARIEFCMDVIQALDLHEYSSHTNILNRPLLPEALASWNPQNQQNRRNCSEKPEYLHEFLCESDSVSTEFKLSIPSNIHPIQALWTDRSFLNHWPVEILKISKIAQIALINLNISMGSCVNRNLFQQGLSTQSPLKFIPYKRCEQRAPSWVTGQLKSSKLAKSVKLQWKTWISPWVLAQIGLPEPPECPKGRVVARSEQSEWRVAVLANPTKKVWRI